MLSHLHTTENAKSVFIAQDDGKEKERLQHLNTYSYGDKYTRVEALCWQKNFIIKLYKMAKMLGS